MRVASRRRQAPVPWVSWWIDHPGSLHLSRTLSCAYDLLLTNDPTCAARMRPLLEWIP